MKKLVINLTEQQLAALEKLIEDGVYNTRSEAVRKAVLLLLENKKMQELEEKLG